METILPKSKLALAYIVLSILYAAHLSGCSATSLLDCSSFGPEDCANLVTDGSSPSLRQVLIITRHGDITPVVFAPKDKLVNESFWYFNGIAQLTNEGKARTYKLGKYMRERYNTFLDDSVNKNIRLSRSSGEIRCIESSQMLLAGLESLETPCVRDASALKWDCPANNLAQIWQPINILAVPQSIDGMLSESNCVEISNQYNQVSNSRYFRDGVGTEYAEEIRVLTEVWGTNYANVFNFSVGVSILGIEGTYFKEKLDPRLLKIYDRVEQAAYAADGLYASTFVEQRLLSGLLLDDLIKSMEGIRDEYSSSRPYNPLTAVYKKLLTYTTHTPNMVSLLQLLGQYRKTSIGPDFCATYVIELHEGSDGPSDWYLRFLYWPTFPGEMVELQVDRCIAGDREGLCRLDKFAQVVADYRIPDWLQWVKECKNDLQQANIYPIPSNAMTTSK